MHNIDTHYMCTSGWRFSAAGVIEVAVVLVVAVAVVVVVVAD